MRTISDWGTAIWTSLTDSLSMVFAFIPRLLGFLIILLVGILVAKALEKALTLILRKVGFDRISDRIGLTRFEQNMGLRMDPAASLGKIVYWFVFLIFLIPAVNALGLTSVSNLLGQVIAYIPNVFVAIIVLLLGTLIATFVADIVRGASFSARIGNPNIFANIARYAIIGFVVIIALYQLQIAQAIIQTLFTAIVGAVALAFGLSFGLGGRESAQRWLARGEEKVNSVSNATSTTVPTYPNATGSTTYPNATATAYQNDRTIPFQNRPQVSAINETPTDVRMDPNRRDFTR